MNPKAPADGGVELPEVPFPWQADGTELQIKNLEGVWENGKIYAVTKRTGYRIGLEEASAPSEVRGVFAHQLSPSLSRPAGTSRSPPGRARGGLSTPLRLWRPAWALNNCVVVRRCMARPMPSSVRDGGHSGGDFGMLRCGGVLSHALWAQVTF
jgi:hypothetical protein